MPGEHIPCDGVIVRGIAAWTPDGAGGAGGMPDVSLRLTRRFGKKLFGVEESASGHRCPSRGMVAIGIMTCVNNIKRRMRHSSACFHPSARAVTDVE
jgi:hypothetical protein